MIIMKRVGGPIAVIVVALMLVTPPAAAQNSSAYFNPKSPDPLESASKVVLSVQMWRAGRVAFRTFDGICKVDFLSTGTPPTACADDQKARAPEDYTATSGELFFSEGGRKTITIPIVDDGLAEGNESFTVVAWEEANADPYWRRGDKVVVRIIDDEVDASGGTSAAPAGGSTTNTSPTVGQTSNSAASGSTVGAPAPTSSKAPGAEIAAGPATTTTTTTAAPTPPPSLQVALPDGGVGPGPGSEPTSEGAIEQTGERRGEPGGSAVWWAIGSGIAVLGVGALAVVQRRRRWSTTQT